MATIYQRLSKKVQQETKLSEVLLILKNGNDYFARGKSGIFVTKDNFKRGSISVNQRKIGNDTEYHEKQLAKMHSLTAYILKKVNKTSKSSINSHWLKSTIYEFYHGTQKLAQDKGEKPLQKAIDEYITYKNFSKPYLRGVKVVFRDIIRFELYQQKTYNSNYQFNPQTVTNNDLELLMNYLRNEASLITANRSIFKDILNISPNGLCRGNHEVKPRGENTVIGLMKKVKAFFLWLNNTGRINNNPFNDIKLGTAHYGTPYYITSDERNIIANYNFTSAYLQRQRDIFIFHCLVGCRISDLMRLTSDNIVDNMLIYAPHKTKDDGAQTLLAHVPLHPQAKKIIEKYKGKTKGNLLLPCTPAQMYNDAIKEIFSIAGITRKVTVRNSITGEPELKPINEIASSHLARRTFVGNAYAKVHDPNIIGKMSGHVEGSQAFARYRNIDDKILEEVIKQL